MLARAQKQVGDVVERRQLLVGDLAEDVDVAGRPGRRSSACSCARYVSNPPYDAGQNQPRPRVVAASCTRGRTGSGCRAACWESAGRRTGCSSSRRRTPSSDARVRRARRDARSPARPAARRRREAERFELLPVELGVAERQIAARSVRQQLAPAVVALPHELIVDAEEILRRRDVVVDEHHPARQRERRARGARSQREVVDQQVVRGDVARRCRDSRPSDPPAADRRSRR